MPSIRILIADDDPLMRSALADLVKADPSLQVVGIAADADEAVLIGGELRPDVAILDVKMPGGGERAAADLRRASPQTRILAFSAYNDRVAVLDMLAAGAVGYLVKGGDPSEILDAIHQVVLGKSILSPHVTGEVVNELTKQIRERRAEEEQRSFHEERVQAVLRESSFNMVFQPIADLWSGECAGVEALVRFPPGDPPRGPDVWFADAEKVGLRQQLEIAVARAQLGILPGLRTGLFLAVNVSPDTCETQDFRGLLETVRAERVVIEITEHAVVQDYDALASSLRGLRARGGRLSVDDTGAGYASFRHVLALQPDFVKLDISLVRNIDTDPVKRSLGAALVAFAAELKAQIIAEGIETQGELEVVRALGIRLGQGYLLARPCPFEDLPQRIAIAA